MENLEHSNDGEAKIINITDHGKAPKLDERILQRFYDLSNRLAKRDASMSVVYDKEEEKRKTNKPTMRVVYSKAMEKEIFAAFLARSDHLVD